MTKARLLKTAIVAAIIGVAGAASVAPASARDHDRNNASYRGDHRDNDRFDRGGRHDHRWRHHRRHFHRGWY